MPTEDLYPVVVTQPGSPAAKTTTAAMVIVLSAVIAGAALVGAITTGSAISGPPRAQHPASSPRPVDVGGSLGSDDTELSRWAGADPID